MNTLEAETEAYGKPVALVHGDTLYFRLDKPLKDGDSGRQLENFTRVEVFGNEDVHWVRAVIDPAHPDVFLFHPEIVNANTKQDDHKNTIVSKAYTTVGTQALQAYWTAELRESAQPMPLLWPAKLKQIARSTPAAFNAASEPLIKSIEPSVALNLTAQAEPSVELEFGVPTPSNLDEYPFNTAGKLYVTAPDGVAYTCSAQFVGAGNVLMTSAHCVYVPVGFNDIVFYRAYDNGEGELFEIACAAVWSKWANSVDGTGFDPSTWDPEWDYAFLYTTEAYTDWIGLEPTPKSTVWTATGYAVGYGNQEVQYRVTGKKGFVLSEVMQMNHNPLDGGSSGGLWFENLEYPYAVGTNSSHCNNTMCSPNFNAQTVTLFEHVRDGKCFGN